MQIVDVQRFLLSDLAIVMKVETCNLSECFGQLEHSGDGS